MSHLLTRRSIRIYDENHKISKDEFKKIFEMSSRAPSSQNLQPTRLLVLESLESKNKIKDALYGNLTQLETSSAMIVLLTDLNKYQKAEQILQQAVDKGYMPLKVKNRQLEHISNALPNIKREKTIEQGILDAGLYAMQLMLTAKEFGYDTCPIGGFNHEKLKDALNLDDNLKPVLIISIGKSADQGFNSTRLPIEDIVTYL